MRRFRCGENNSFRSVVGIDRTFNLGPCYVTVTVYTNHSVVRTDSRTSPTFVGPMYLHWDGKYQTYVDIFTDLRAAKRCPRYRITCQRERRRRLG